MATRNRTSLASPPTGGDLARLLETEARLEEVLRRAQDEAARLVAAARADAAAREAALAADLEAESARLRATIEAEYRRRSEQLSTEAGTAVERFDQIGPDQVEALARHVVARVIGVEP